MGFSSQAAVSQYLNARLPLNMSAVAKFAKVLKTKVEDISPRYAKMVGNPIPSALEGYIAPQTGSIGGVHTDRVLNWIACSQAFLDAMGVRSLKLFRNADDSLLLIDDSPQKNATDGTYLLMQGEDIVVRRVTITGQNVVIQDGKKMTVSKEAFSLIKVLARVVARIEQV